MKTLNNEIIISRGESFTIDNLIQNKDGSPYIISRELVKPYFVISISNSRYFQNDRILKRYWLDLSNIPRFISTVAIDLKSFKTAADSNVSNYSDFPPNTGIIEGYVDGVLTRYFEGSAVFYLTNSSGKTIYKYYDTTSNAWKNYSCRIVKHFNSEDTEGWVEQTYYYNIFLVSGNNSNDTAPLTEISLKLPILQPTKLSVLSNL